MSTEIQPTRVEEFIKQMMPWAHGHQVIEPGKKYPARRRLWKEHWLALKAPWLNDAICWCQDIFDKVTSRSSFVCGESAATKSNPFLCKSNHRGRSY
jgi:hypothetical protein